MSNTVIEGLFLLACLVPPATILVGALLLVKIPSMHRSGAQAHAAPGTP